MKTIFAIQNYDGLLTQLVNSFEFWSHGLFLYTVSSEFYLHHVKLAVKVLGMVWTIISRMRGYPIPLSFSLRFTTENEGLSFHPLFILSVLKKIRGSVRWGRRPVRCSLPAAIVSDDGVERPGWRAAASAGVLCVWERRGWAVRTSSSPPVVVEGVGLWFRTKWWALRRAGKG